MILAQGRLGRTADRVGRGERALWFFAGRLGGTGAAAGRFAAGPFSDRWGSGLLFFPLLKLTLAGLNPLLARDGGGDHHRAPVS